MAALRASLTSGAHHSPDHRFRSASRLLVMAAAVLLGTSQIAEASPWTRFRDIVTAPVRVPAQAVVQAVQHPTLHNIVSAGISPVAAAKDAADNAVAGVNEFVEGHPAVKKVIENKQISVTVPTGTPGGGVSTPGPSDDRSESGPTSSPPPAETGNTVVTTSVSERSAAPTTVLVIPLPSVAVSSAGAAPSSPVSAPTNIVPPSPSDTIGQHVDVDGDGYEIDRRPAAAYDESRHSPAANRLKKAADDGVTGNETYCNKSVAATLHGMDNNELADKSANDQIEYMKNHWRSVSGQDARALAEQGKIAVAGLEDKDHGPSVIG
jgi:hypothetical protein